MCTVCCFYHHHHVVRIVIFVALKIEIFIVLLEIYQMLKIISAFDKIIYNISVPHICQTFLPLSFRHTLLQRERLIQAFDFEADFPSCYFQHLVILGLIPQFESRSSILVSFLGYFARISSIT